MKGILIHNIDDDHLEEFYIFIINNYNNKLSLNELYNSISINFYEKFSSNLYIVYPKSSIINMSISSDYNDIIKINYKIDDNSYEMQCQMFIIDIN